jgi:hypothetical protein
MDEKEPDQEDGDIFGGLGRVFVDEVFSQEDSEAAVRAAGPTTSTETGKVKEITVGLDPLSIENGSAAPRVLKLTPTHLRLVFMPAGSLVAYAAVVPWKRIESYFVNAEGLDATIVLKTPPTFWCQHKESATKADEAQKLVWSEASVTDPTPDKIGSTRVMWTLLATTKGGFKKLHTYIEGLMESQRPARVLVQPAASNAVFAPATTIAEGSEEVPRGVPLGAQTDVPHCRSHPKQVVKALRELDSVLSKALERRPTHVPDVFDEEKSQQFLQVYRDALKEIVTKFHAEIATTPALVFGVASTEGAEPEE